MYDYNGKIIPLLIRFSEMTGRHKAFEDVKTMNFTCEDDELL